MNISSLVGLALICASIIVLLRNYSPEFAIPISAITSIIILIVSIVFVNEIFEKITEIASLSAITSSNLKMIFKSLGVCYIVQIGKDVCNDCGETALADKVDLAGKITIAAMSIEIITQVVEIVLEIVNT